MEGVIQRVGVWLGVSRRRTWTCKDDGVQERR
jgi:hypothetical protein